MRILFFFSFVACLLVAQDTQPPPKKRGFLDRMNDKLDKLSEKLDDKPKSAAPKQAEPNPAAARATDQPTTAQPGGNQPANQVTPPLLRTTPRASSKGRQPRVPLDLSSSIPALQPDRCAVIPDGQWECVQAILKASAQNQSAAVRDLAAPEWNVAKYLPTPNESFRNSCGNLRGVWRMYSNRQPRPPGPSRQTDFALGYLEFEQCMIQYSMSFNGLGQVKSFEMQWTPPRLGYLSEAETVKEEMRTVVRDAGELFLLAYRGDAAEVERAMRNKGFSKPDAAILIKLARNGIGFGGFYQPDPSDYGEIKYCGFGSGEKNGANHGLFSVNLICVYEDWYRRVSVLCTSPGACSFTGTEN